MQGAREFLAIQVRAVIAFEQNSDVALVTEVMCKAHRLVELAEFLEQAFALLERTDFFGAGRAGINPVHDSLRQSNDIRLSVSISADHTGSALRIFPPRGATPLPRSM